MSGGLGSRTTEEEPYYADPYTRIAWWQKKFEDEVEQRVRAEEALRENDEQWLARFNALRTDRERLRSVIKAIEDNARSWHGPPSPDSGHVRALKVITEWCEAALAVVSPKPTDDDFSDDPQAHLQGRGS